MKESLELQRHLLGSIDLSDIEEKDQSSQERKDYCAAIFAVYPRLEKDIKKFLYSQLLFSSNQAETWEQVIFGRGSYNGLSLLLEHWKAAAIEHESSNIPDPPLEENSPISEV